MLVTPLFPQNEAFDQHGTVALKDHPRCILNARFHLFDWRIGFRVTLARRREEDKGRHTGTPSHPPFPPLHPATASRWPALARRRA